MILRLLCFSIRKENHTNIKLYVTLFSDEPICSQMLLKLFSGLPSLSESYFSSPPSCSVTIGEKLSSFSLESSSQMFQVSVLTTIFWHTDRAGLRYFGARAKKNLGAPFEKKIVVDFKN